MGEQKEVELDEVPRIVSLIQGMKPHESIIVGYADTKPGSENIVSVAVKGKNNRFDEIVVGQEDFNTGLQWLGQQTLKDGISDESIRQLATVGVTLAKVNKILNPPVDNRF